MLRFFIIVVLLLSLFQSNGFAQANFKLGVEVKDKYTKSSLVPIISVLEVNSVSELKGQMVGDWYVVSVKPNTQYQVFVALQEYKTYRQTHTFDPNTSTPINDLHLFSIELESVNPPKNIPASLPVATMPLPNKTEAKTTEPLKAEPKKILTRQLQWIAVDAQTNQPIAAQFKLTDETKESYTGKTNTEGGSFNPTVVIQKQPYLLLVTANGYRKYESKIIVTSESPTGQKPQVIKLSSIDIMLKIKILDNQTAQPLAANLRLIDQTDKRPIADIKDTPRGLASIALNPTHRYLIQAEAKGFMSYQQALEKVLPNLEETSELTIKLNKIGDNYLQLTAVNEANRKPIAATFKITASMTEQTTEIKATQPHTPAKYKITEPDIYYIEATAPSYTSIKHEIDAQEMSVGQVFSYEAQLTPSSSKASSTLSKVFTFKVLDAKTRKLVPKLHFTILNTVTQKTIPPKLYASGAQVNLQIDQNYLIEIEANDYESVSIKVDAAVWAKRGEYLTNISLVPLKKNTGATKSTPVVNEKIFDNIKAGQSLSIEDNVYFDQSSYILRSEAHGQLNRLAAIMRKNPDISIEIIGHTDNIGDSRLNQMLSEQRAKVIANYLNNQGVNEAMIAHRGEGASKPLAPNDSEENRQRNRRVQFLIR